MGKCGQCALKHLEGGVCPVFKSDMSEEDGCPLFKNELKTCSICGSVILEKGILEEDDGKWHLLCGRCLSAPDCQICGNQYCAFQQDQSCQEPPYVMREMRQGNMIMQTQVMNPKRIEATCRKDCPCFNEDGLDNGTFCGRQQGTGCRNHKIIWRD